MFDVSGGGNLSMGSPVAVVMYEGKSASNQACGIRDFWVESDS